MMRQWLRPAAVVAALVVVQLAIVAWTVSGVVLTGSRSFPIRNIAAATVVSQVFEAASPGLSALTVRAELHGAAATPALPVRIVRLANAAAPEQEVRRVTGTWVEGRCCDLVFAPLADVSSAYRLDLLPRDPSVVMVLRARPALAEGGLSMNGTTVQANLDLRPRGAPLYRLRNASRLPRFLLLVCFAVIDAAALLVVGRLVAAGGAGTGRDAGPTAAIIDP